MASYANAVGVHLGHASRVVDHFHLQRLANAVSTTSAGACSRPPSGTAVASTTRCTGPASCCWRALIGLHARLIAAVRGPGGW